MRKFQLSDETITAVGNRSRGGSTTYALAGHMSMAWNQLTRWSAGKPTPVYGKPLLHLGRIHFFASRVVGEDIDRHQGEWSSGWKSPSRYNSQPKAIRQFTRWLQSVLEQVESNPEGTSELPASSGHETERVRGNTRIAKYIPRIVPNSELTELAETLLPVLRDESRREAFIAAFPTPDLNNCIYGQGPVFPEINFDEV